MTFSNEERPFIRGQADYLKSSSLDRFRYTREPKEEHARCQSGEKENEALLHSNYCHTRQLSLAVTLIDYYLFPTSIWSRSLLGEWEHCNNFMKNLRDEESSSLGNLLTGGVDEKVI